MIKNCTSLAFKLEAAVDPEYIGPDDGQVFSAIAEMAEKNNRKIREVEDEFSHLENGEWLIIFIGFWDIKVLSFGCFYNVHDYHFALRQDDGTWVEQELGNDSPVKQTTLEKLREFANKEELPCRFFAVSKVT